jgi:hypothetical protein
MNLRFIAYCMVLLLFCGEAHAFGVAWHEPNAQYRAVMTLQKGPEASVLVTVPFSGEGECMARAFRSDGRETPLTIVGQSGSSLYVLVRTSRQSKSSNNEFFVYYGVGLRERPDSLVNNDSSPVTVEIYAGSGRSMPTDWSRMRYLIGKAGRPNRTTTQAGTTVDNKNFASRTSSRRSRNHNHNRSRFSLLWMSTHLVVPEDGLYRFAIDCADAGFVMMDRRIVAQWPGKHSGGQWKKGRPAFVKAGTHEIEVFRAGSKPAKTRVGVSGPSDKGVFKLIEEMHLVSAAVPRALRIEEKGKTLHAGFSFSLGRPYKFRDMDQLFVPVALKDFSHNDLAWSYTVSWLIGGDGAMSMREDEEAESEGFQTERKPLKGSLVMHVFDREGLHTVKAMVRDSLGFVSTMEREVETRNLHYQEYAVNAVPVNVSPCKFPDDVVDPTIRVSSKGSSSLSFLLEWKWVDGKGKERKGKKTLSARQKVNTVQMFSSRAGNIRNIEWELSHRGYRIEGGSIKYCQFPFASLPARVVEDRVYDAKGTQLVYVSPRLAGNFIQPKIGASHIKGGVTSLDDTFLSVQPLSGEQINFSEVLGKMLDLDERAMKSTHLSSRGRHDQLGTASVLLEATKATESGGGVAVLSFGLDHYLSYNQPDEYERLLAVVTDILLSRRAMRTIIATPLPVGVDKEDIREYAVAARRVADARGIPVADLYSGFMGMAKNVELFAGGGPDLSDAGVRLAGQIISRTIVAGYRAKEID